MICIPGYDLLETVFTGQKVKLCRALSLSDGKKVLLKIDQYGDKGMAAARCLTSWLLPAIYTCPLFAGP